MSAVRHLLNRLRDRGRMLAGEPFFDCRMSAAQLELLDQFGIDLGLGLDVYKRQEPHSTTATQKSAA